MKRIEIGRVVVGGLYREHGLRDTDGSRQFTDVDMSIAVVEGLATDQRTRQELVIVRSVEDGHRLVGTRVWFAQRFRPLTEVEATEAGFSQEKITENLPEKSFGYVSPSQHL